MLAHRGKLPQAQTKW